MNNTKLFDISYFRKRINILDVMVDELTIDEAVSSIEMWSQQKREDSDIQSRRIVTANPEYIMAARSNPELLTIINSAAMVTPDGVGVTMAGRLFKTPFPSRITGVELTHALAQSSSQTGLRLFLLGAGPGIAEKAASKLEEIYPGVVIAGCFAGLAGPEGDTETIAHIKEAHPDVVLVAYGMPKQDFWAVRNLHKTGAAVAIGVGGTFDFLSGKVPWAPKIMRDIGLEWVYRLYQEPWRWYRDIAMLKFGSKVMFQSIIGLRVVSKTGQSIKGLETVTEEYLLNPSTKQTA